MRDVNYYIRTAKEKGEQQGVFMAELLSGDVPWAFLRQAQNLLRLNDKYGSARVESACARAVNFGLMNVKRVEGIIRQAMERESTPAAHITSTVTHLSPARFQRQADYFTHHTTKENDHGINH